MECSVQRAFERLGVCREMKLGTASLHLDGGNTASVTTVQIKKGKVNSAFIFTNGTYKNRQDLLTKVKCYLRSYGAQNEIPQKPLVLFSFAIF
jgi:hypothetical protein